MLIDVLLAYRTCILISVIIYEQAISFFVFSSEQICDNSVSPWKRTTRKKTYVTQWLIRSFEVHYHPRVFIWLRIGNAPWKWKTRLGRDLKQCLLSLHMDYKHCVTVQAHDANGIAAAKQHRQEWNWMELVVLVWAGAGGDESDVCKFQSSNCWNVEHQSSGFFFYQFQRCGHHGLAWIVYQPSGYWR